MPPPAGQNYLIVPAIRGYGFRRRLCSGEAFTNVGKNYSEVLAHWSTTYFFGEPSLNERGASGVVGSGAEPGGIGLGSGWLLGVDRIAAPAGQAEMRDLGNDGRMFDSDW